jgi:hypothetical protein
VSHPGKLSTLLPLLALGVEKSSGPGSRQKIG